MRTMHARRSSSAEGRHLSLAPEIRRAPHGLGETRRRVSLCGAPYRPGELPHPIRLTLDENARENANRAAQNRRLPVELVIRARVDAARTITSLTAAGFDHVSVVGTLNEAATSSAGSVTAEASLLEYARLVHRGEAAALTSVRGDGSIELLLPLDLSLAWRLEARAALMTIDDWVAERFSTAPDDAVTWEAAAAARGLRVPEWGYACALSRSAS